MRSLTLLILIVTFFVGCSEKKKDSGIPADVTFTVTEEVPNQALKKCNLKVTLNKRISEDVLRKIAQKIRDERTQYDKLWVFYYLQDASSTSMPWATTHFTPTLEVAIIGSSSEQSEKQKSVVAEDGEQIGKWIDDTALPGSNLIILKKDGKYILRTVIKEGGHFDEDVVKKGKARYDDVVGEKGEYFIIEPSGDLGMYNKEGKRFAIAKKTP